MTSVGEDIASDQIAIVKAYQAGHLGAAYDAIRRDNERAIEFHCERLRRAGGLM